MAYWYATTPTIGTDLNNSLPVTTLGSETIGSTTVVRPPHKPGTTVVGNSSTEWTYTQATGAITAGDIVVIGTSGTAQRATPALVAAGAQIGFAQNAFADTDFGWIMTKGGNATITVNVSATSTLNVPLYVATTSGKLSTTASSGTLAGVAILTASTTAVAASFSALLSWPRSPSAE